MEASSFSSRTTRRARSRQHDPPKQASVALLVPLVPPQKAAPASLPLYDRMDVVNEKKPPSLLVLGQRVVPPAAVATARLRGRRDEEEGMGGGSRPSSSSSSSGRWIRASRRRRRSAAALFGGVVDDDNDRRQHDQQQPRRRHAPLGGGPSTPLRLAGISLLLLPLLLTVSRPTATAALFVHPPPLSHHLDRGRNSKAAEWRLRHAPARYSLVVRRPSGLVRLLGAADSDVGRHAEHDEEEEEEARTDDGPQQQQQQPPVEEWERVRWHLEQQFMGARIRPDDDADGNDNTNRHSSVVGLAGAAQLYRSQLEISLLESLLDSDDAVDELVNLWIHATTSNNADVLEQMSVECSPGMQVEQDWLRATIQSYPEWVEPRVRLATLLFYKGETTSSYQHAVEAYRQMPYHFEIVPLLVMISLREGNMGTAIQWARVGLPTLRGTNASSRRRAQWVRNATEFVRQRQRQVELRLEQEQEEDRKKRSEKKKQQVTSTNPSITDGSASWQ